MQEAGSMKNSKTNNMMSDNIAPLFKNHKGTLNLLLAIDK